MTNVSPRSIRLRILKEDPYLSITYEMPSFTTLDPLEDTERHRKVAPGPCDQYVSPRSIRLRILKVALVTLSISISH